MTRHGSFYPLPREFAPTPVLFAYVLDTPEQRQAVQQEILDRVTAIQELSQTVASSQLDCPEPRSHFGIAEAVAILSRDVNGLLEAYFDTGP
jgi:hypothetical protein